MRAALLISVALLAACESSGVGGGQAPADAGADGRAADFVAFTSATRVIDRDESGGGSLVLVLTDATGPSACGLGSEGAVPVGAATAVRIEVDSDGGTQCPDGTFALDLRDGRCGILEQGGLRVDCAEYTRWSDDGSERTSLLAVSGAVTLRDLAPAGGRQRCGVDLDVRFPGGRVAEAFEIEYDAAVGLPICAP